MKKYLYLIALCLSSFVHGNGLANLKAIQDQFHALIYQAGDLSVAEPAPEVPYIAGLLKNPIYQIGEDAESNYIYGALYDKKSPRARKAIAGIDQAKADAFDALPFDFARYDGYQYSGHSVLGVAAQEGAAAVAEPSSVTSSLSSSSASAGGRMNFGGGSNPFAAAKLGSGKKNVAVSAPRTPVVAAAPQSLLQKVQARRDGLRDKQKKSKDDNADIAILSELEDELSGKEERDGDQQERYKALLIYFNDLISPSPDQNVVIRIKGGQRSLQEQALIKFSQQGSASVSPANAAVASGTALDASIEIAAAKKGVAAATSLFGNAASNPMLAKMEAKKAAEKAAEKAAISTIDTLIQKAFSKEPMQDNNTERAIDKCINGSIDFVPTSITDNKMLLERLLEKLSAVNLKTAQQEHNIQIIRKRIPKIADDSEEDDDDGDEKDYSAISSSDAAPGLNVSSSANSLASGNTTNSASSPFSGTSSPHSSSGNLASGGTVGGGVQSPPPAAGGASPPAFVPPPPPGPPPGRPPVVQQQPAAVAVAGGAGTVVNSEQVLGTIQDLITVNGKEYLPKVTLYLDGLIAPGVEGTENRKSYLNQVRVMLEDVETTSIAATKRSAVAKAIGIVKANIGKELASQK